MSRILPAMRFALYAALILVAMWAGLALREWTFEATKPIRFHGDVENAVAIGRSVVIDAARRQAATTNSAATAASDHATPKRLLPSWPQLFSSYFDLYDAEYARVAAHGAVADSTFRLDYPPGRLLIVSAWCKRIADERGILFGYSDEIVRPMLNVNSAHEGMAALGAFALVWTALRRAGTSAIRSELGGLLAGMLLWFNPAMILDAHGWPQWDAWVLPYALWAAFFALRDRWMICGALLAAGALFKGQVLLIAPLFALWPLFQFRLGAVARLAVGMAATLAVSGSPWLIFRGDPFTRWWAIIAIAMVFVFVFWPPRSLFGAAWILAAVGVFGWFCVASRRAGAIALPLSLVAAALLAGGAVLRRPPRLAMSLAATAVILFAAGAAFDGSFAWLRVGFQTDHYPELHRGPTVNLGAILERFYGYGSDSSITVGTWTVRLRMLMRAIAFTGVAIAALGLSLRERARDANMLVGLVAAWTVLYAFMPQMHERYLVWAAATSAVLATRSFGGFLVHLALTVLQSAMLLCSMIEAGRQTNDPTFGPIHFVVRGMSPAAGWATMTLAILLLVWSFSCRASVPRRHLPAPSVP